mmetsp:Transcript_16851/g.25303  ORF Transcript_16851/g.25303 Transcript_16851/m.25303 type:complete len:290 (-) Transcript_16851:72-941(-)
MMKFASVALSLLALSPASIQGFTVSNSNRLTLASVSQQSQVAFAAPSFSRSKFVLNVADDKDAESSEEGSDVEAAAEAEEVTAEAEVTEDEPKEEADEVDEEEAIKKEIAELENTLRNKNRELDSIEKMGEQYTDGGYARKVAEMEQTKKSKTAASADNKLVAMASVLQNFLPVVDELKALTEKYEGDEFAKKYGALSSDFNSALKNMGVTEYVVAAGDAADASRVTAVEEVHSDDVAKGIVISAVNSGYEMDGNIMRMAEAVLSLGAEAEAEPAAEVSEETAEVTSEE